MYGSWGIWGAVFNLIFTILIIVGIVLLIYWIVSQFTRSEQITTKSKSLEILRERYAKGEISKEEFESMKKDLEKL